jgi:hypothetical protein
MILGRPTLSLRIYLETKANARKTFHLFWTVCTSPHTAVRRQ